MPHASCTPGYRPLREIVCLARANQAVPTRAILSQEDTVDPPASAVAPRRRAGTRSLRAVVAAGSLLLVVASRVLAGVKKLWERVPGRVQGWGHAVLDPTGVPYVLGFLASYDKARALSNFAGNLFALKAAYVSGSMDQREKLDQQFKGIVDALVMKNGVTKSTHATRQNRILTKVLADAHCRPQKSSITVLEVPASTGITALDNFATLSQYYRIQAYVLGDLFFRLYYDTDRECVFDEEFNLLQVKLKKRFFSTYRAARSGERYTGLTTALMFPFELASWYLKKKYAYSTTSTNVPILVLHPDVEARLRTGDLTVRTMDVFLEVGDRYDVILCFNLLLRDYFPEDQIAKGTENLKHALNEQGFLIMGDEVSFSVAQKRGDSLFFIKNEGRF